MLSEYFFLWGYAVTGKFVATFREGLEPLWRS